MAVIAGAGEAIHPQIPGMDRFVVSRLAMTALELSG